MLPLLLLLLPCSVVELALALALAPTLTPTLTLTLTLTPPSFDRRAPGQRSG
jgi:hypothetical protein